MPGIEMDAGAQPPGDTPPEDDRLRLPAAPDAATWVEPVRPPGIGNAWRRARDSLRWTELHRRLAGQPVFSACSRSEIRWIARSGDEVEVDAGEPLLREDTIGYWFVVVLSGSVTLVRRRREVATLLPGNHVGEVAILGFGPQPATAIAATHCRLFVVGRRELLSLAHILPSVQQGLFPGIDPAGFVAKVRTLRSEGNDAWRSLPAPARTRAGLLRADVSWVTPPAPGRPVPAAPGSFARLAGRALRRDAEPVLRPTTGGLPARIVVLPVAATVVVGSVAFGLLWHPPVVVVSPGEPIDVSADLTVDGVPVHEVNGRYLLMPVDVERPTLARYLTALARGRRTLSLDDAGDNRDARRAGREAFSEARRHAVVAAAAALGVDPARVDVRFRARDVQGPSAGLIYALVLVDLLDPEDLARGRTIAATGVLDGDGRVHRVSFVREKSSAARRAAAHLLLVPAGQDPRRDGVDAREVRTLAEAVAALKAA